MLISRKSIISGQMNTMDLDVTEHQLLRWEAGELIQDVFPHLDASEREFMMSGITPKEWNKMFKESNL
jgi:hypothetical protein